MSWFDKINKKISIVSSDDIPKWDVIPLGIPPIDHTLGGGIACGRFGDVYGPSATGKSALAYQWLAQVERRGGTPFVVDAEHAFQADFYKSLGGNQCHIIEDLHTVEDTFQFVHDLCVTAAKEDATELKAVFIDSLAALGTRHLDEKGMDKRDMSKAFAIGQGLVLTLPKVKECNVAVLFSNQVREKIDANGNASRDSATHTPGGNAPQFDYSQRLELRFAGGSKTSAIFDEDSGFQIGSRVLARCQKSRLGSPWGTCILPFYTLPGYPHPVFDGVETKFGYDIAESMWYFYQNGRFFVGEGEDEGTVVHSPSQGWYALHPMFDPHETKFRGKDWLNILAAHPELWRLPYEDLEIAPSDYPYLPCDEVVKEAE